MNKLFRAAIPALLIATPAVVALAGVPEPIVYMSADKDTDFAKYRSYSWVTPSGDGVSQAEYDRARASIDRALASRFQRADPGDFAIAISGVASPKGEYHGSYKGSIKRPSLLVVDIYDTKTKTPFWHGVVRAASGDLDRAVDRLMNYFPPSRGCPTSPLDQRFSECDY